MSQSLIVGKFLELEQKLPTKPVPGIVQVQPAPPRSPHSPPPPQLKTVLKVVVVVVSLVIVKLQPAPVNPEVTVNI